MSTQITTTKDKINSVRAMLEKSKAQMALALPKHLSVDRMTRVAMTSIQKTPKLLECTPQSLIAAIIQCAQLGLEPDGVTGESYLVPYKTTCQLIPGYKGLIKLARQSGQLSTISARAVYEHDKFDYAYGLNEKLEHTPTQSDDPGKLAYVYAVAKLKDGGTQFEVMAVREINAIRSRSRAADSGPWVTDFVEMAKKTVLRRLCKMLPASVELSRAVALDERVDAGLDQELGDIFDGEFSEVAQELEQPPPAPSLDTLAEAPSKVRRNDSHYYQQNGR